MPNRTAAFVSAIFVACLTGIALTPTSTRAAPAEAAAAADECLSAPKAATPAGGHWYYRIEKGTKRKCWYLGDAGGKTGKTASANPSSKPDAESTPEDQSLANARAEIPRGRMSPEENSEQTKLAETTWPPLEPATDAAVRNDTTANSAQTLIAQDLAEGSNIASRWPAVTSVASADAQPQTEARAPPPVLTADKLAAIAAKPQQAANPQPISQPQDTAQAQVEESVMTPVRMLLLLLTGALVLAAILGRMIVKRLSARRNVPGHRRPIWDAASSDDEALPYIQDLSAPRRTYGAARELPMLDDRNPSKQADEIEELEELLQRASKRSAA